MEGGRLMAEAIAVRGKVRVVMDDGCGEGIEGDYDDEDQEDVPLMRFEVQRKYKGKWVFCADSSYCTQIDARLTKKEHKRLAELILNQVYDDAESITEDPENDYACKKTCEGLSWINPTWGTGKEEMGWVLP